MKQKAKALLAAGLLASSMGANADTYIGTWDPLFSPPFTNLWWRGQALFDTGPCTANGLHVNAGPCAGMKVSNVVIEFANSFGGPALQTLDFQAAFGAMTAVQITGMQMSGGLLVGVYTEPYLVGIQGAITESQLAGPVQQPYFSVAFVGPLAQLGYKREGAYSFSCSWVNNALSVRGDCGAQAADIRFTLVPPNGGGGNGSTLTVGIDIKPGSMPNSINPHSKGVIPVAILSSATFNAPSEVLVSELTFGRYGTEKSLRGCNATAEDVNGDGRLDLVCHFDTQAASFVGGDLQAVLMGRTVGGQQLKGTDAVKIVP